MPMNSHFFSCIKHCFAHMARHSLLRYCSRCRLFNSNNRCISSRSFYWRPLEAYILVKINTVWDRRLVLICGRKLREISEFSRVYIHHRRRTSRSATYIRRRSSVSKLMRNASTRQLVLTGINWYQLVSVSNGVLSIDGIELFSLSSGFINSSQSSDQIAINV